MEKIFNTARWTWAYAKWIAKLTVAAVIFMTVIHISNSHKIVRVDVNKCAYAESAAAATRCVTNAPWRN